MVVRRLDIHMPEDDIRPFPYTINKINWNGAYI